MTGAWPGGVTTFFLVGPELTGGLLQHIVPSNINSTNTTFPKRALVYIGGQLCATVHRLHI